MAFASAALSRRKFVRGSLALAALPAGAAVLAACGSDDGSEAPVAKPVSENVKGLTPDQALEKLKEGNKRFVALQNEDINESRERRISVFDGQSPFAAIIGCVDSRVPPELVFDRGLGDLFVARVAAAIADDSVVGSIEFGVSEFGIPLVVAMGHAKCGAVAATIEAVENNQSTAPGQILSVVKPIIPAVQDAMAAGVSEEELLGESIRLSVERTVAALNQSEVLSALVAENKVKVVGAVYSLATGEVTFFE
ncbi:MAG: carbonic anhydrase [Acidimicrobiales bacterium]